MDTSVMKGKVEQELKCVGFTNEQQTAIVRAIITAMEGVPNALKDDGNFQRAIIDIGNRALEGL